MRWILFDILLLPVFHKLKKPNVTKEICAELLLVCACIFVLKSCMCVILICINFKIICDFPFLPFSLLSDEPLPGRNKISIIGRNAASALIQFARTQCLYQLCCFS